MLNLAVITEGELYISLEEFNAYDSTHAIVTILENSILFCVSTRGRGIFIKQASVSFLHPTFGYVETLTHLAQFCTHALDVKK
jgi:hypothetical protein